MKWTKGFTLIELLVVISIIALLSSVVLTSISVARKKARNIQRITQAKEVYKAIEMYYDDNGKYPGTGNFTKYHNVESDNFIPGLVPKYIKNIQEDPAFRERPGVPGSYDCTQIYIRSNDNAFKYLFGHACLYDVDYRQNPEFLDPNRDGGVDACKVDASGSGAWSYALYSSEGVCL